MKLRSSLFLILALVGILSLNSCVKKYRCECAITYSGAPGLPDSITKGYEITDTRDGAKSLCEDESFEHEENGIKIKEVCKLF